MMGTGIIELVMMLALPMGGGNDLLDFLSTDEFWASQGVQVVSRRAMMSELRVVQADDISSLIKQLSDVKFQTREVATREILYLGPSVIPQLEAAAKNTTGETALRARSLVRILAGSPQTSSARQLMAIRTLGELRHRKAIGPLQGFLKSKKPFVADYAARAIARIEGKPSPRHRPTRAELDEDVWILPAKCAVVGQAALLRPIPLSFEKALEKMGPERRRRGRSITKSDLLKRFNSMTLAAAHSLGNIRLDALTLGVSDDIDARGKGFVVVVARGQYDRKAVVATLRKEIASAGRFGGGFGGGFSMSRIDGVDVLSFFGVFQVLLVSDSRMIFIGGPGGAGAAVKEMIAAAKRGKGTLHENKKLAALVKSVDRSKLSLWAAMVPSEHYKKFPLLAAFDSMTLTAVQHEDGSVTGKLLALGADGDKRRAAIAMMEMGRAEGTREMRREAQRMPAAAPFVAFMESIKHRQDDKSVTVTAKIDDPGAMLMMPLVMVASQGFRF